MAQSDTSRKGFMTSKPNPLSPDAAPQARPREGNHYGRPLTVGVEKGALVIRIGVQTLAHATVYADWANPFDEARDDYIRTFAIVDPRELAVDVGHAMMREREDGSTPLSDFLDAMTQAAIDDGSLACHEDEQHIKHGETAECETWAEKK